jgi:hypothetical protein
VVRRLKVCSLLVNIREVDYPEFKEMMALPSAYQDWLKGHLAGDANRTSDGRDQVCTVLPNVFREYLTDHGKVASEAELAHCATDIAKALGGM